MVQGGSQYLICMFVFNVLPKIYKDVCKNKPKIVENRRTQPARSLVSCDQCKLKSSLTDMKKHMLTAHGRLKGNKPTETERTRLMQHIEAVHVNSWRSQIVQNEVETSNEEELMTPVEKVGRNDIVEED